MPSLIGEIECAVDMKEPIRAVIPSLDGPVLQVLARTGSALTGLEVHRLTSRGSADGVRRALRRLVAQGVVRAESRGASVLYTLNRDHLAAPAIEALANLGSELRRRIISTVATWDPPAVHVSLFGSAARGEGDEHSDIDLLIVRRRDVAVHDEAWIAQVDALASAVESWTGNDAQVLELSEDEVAIASERSDAIIRELRRGAIKLHGPTIARLYRRGEGAR